MKSCEPFIDSFIDFELVVDGDGDVIFGGGDLIVGWHGGLKVVGGWGLIWGFLGL